MADVIPNEEQQAPRDIEDQLWPIVCATVVLVGVLVTVIKVNSDFDDDRLLLNGYTQLVGVAALGAGIIFLGSLVKGRARRTAELAILFSLALHAMVGLGAGYVFNLPIDAAGQHTLLQEAAFEADDEPPPADYHWGQSDDEGAKEQAFEKPMATRIRDQMPPAAQVEPRNLERPVPVADMPRTAKVDVSPLGVGAATAPSKPLDVHRSDAARMDNLPPAQALAMARQKADELAVPDAPAPAPEALPTASKEPGPSIDARGVQVEKGEKYYWATVAKKMADPNNLPIPAPHGRPKRGESASDPLPSPAIVAKLPSQAPPRTSNADSGAEPADKISQQGGTPERSDRGSANMPSGVMADPELPPTLAAAAGGSPGSRLESVSDTPVERSENSHAPLGPSIASAGNQDLARGSSLLPARRGALDVDGRAEPSLQGAAASEASEIRSGSPDSSSNHGLPLWAGSARRGVASQTDDGGAGLSSDQSARLPRTQSETGVPLPVAGRIADDASTTGAGGAASRPGGMASALEVTGNTAIQRVAGNGDPTTYHGFGRTGPGDGALSDTAGASGGQSPGLGRIGARRVAGGADTGDVNNDGGFPRTRGAGFDPRATLDPAGAIGGAANISQGPAPGAGPQGNSTGIAEPNVALGGAARLGGPGQRIGTRPAGALEPMELASSVGIAAPRAGLGGRGQGDGQLDQILSGQGDGPGGTGRGHGQFVVNSLVHEPLDAFRRGAVRGGAALGDSGDGQLTEPAIENGLAFFARSQFADGHWSLHDTPPGIPRDPDSDKKLDADTAATGLALLSYMAAGYTHQDEKYRETIRRGIGWLVKHQAADGDLFNRGSRATHFYCHGIATIALCEAYGMTQDRDLREPAQKAIDFIVRSQDPVHGGWRYDPDGWRNSPAQGSDTSVSGWQLMALKSAQMAGLDVPDETIRKFGHWLDLAQVSGGRYVYNPWNLDTEDERAGRAPSRTMTAQAMVMRMYLGQDRDPAVLQQGADYLKENLPQVDAGAKPDCYYWYYATQAMYHMQGDYWKAWDARVTPLVRAGQVARGPLRGSWSATEPVPDQWGQQAGRHYVTAMHVLTLEFRYWHLPLFRELRRD